jgi:hypothetical protein
MWYVFTVGPCQLHGYISKSDRIRSEQLQVVAVAEERKQTVTSYVWVLVAEACEQASKQ